MGRGKGRELEWLREAELIENSVKITLKMMTVRMSALNEFGIEYEKRSQ